ncbi:MAG: AraC family transcriptional regulator [Deltaproteobacteria bacterium]|nr:AraC family transcriptional regulator [Deltaproteobacteria bacterium]
MDYYPRLAQSIDFIEDNLTCAISLEDVSQRAYSSLSHFHRIFAFMTGFGINTTLENDQVATDIPAFMDNFFINKKSGEIPGIIKPEIFYGIYSNLDVHNNFRFTIAYETKPLKQVPEELEQHVIPPRNYAVFTATGPMPEKLVNAWHYIYGNWLPNSPYERETGIDFEVYDTRTLQENIASVDIYIPLKIVQQ